jgi:hypothetical protein
MQTIYIIPQSKKTAEEIKERMREAEAITREIQVRTLCTLCTILCTIHYMLYTIHYTLTLYTIHYTLYTLHYTLYTIHCTLYTVHYTLYTVHYTLTTQPLYTIHTTGAIGALPTGRQARFAAIFRDRGPGGRRPHVPVLAALVHTALCARNRRRQAGEGDRGTPRPPE